MQIWGGLKMACVYSVQFLINSASCLQCIRDEEAERSLVPSRQHNVCGVFTYMICTHHTSAAALLILISHAAQTPLIPGDYSL